MGLHIKLCFLIRDERVCIFHMKHEYIYQYCMVILSNILLLHNILIFCFQIQLSPSETVREIYGSTGNFSGQNVVRTLKIVTSAGTVYGPYGTESSGSGPFHEVAPDNHGFTGFYGRTSQFVNQLGFYVGPN